MINIYTTHTDEACAKYYSAIKPIITPLIDRLIKDDLKQFLKSNLGEIICSKPERLLELQANFNSLWTIDDLNYKVEEIKTNIIKNKVLFDYGSLTDKQKYNLMSSVGVNTCPYCNTAYIVTDKIGRTRPEIDHFYPQTEFVLLSLSFYNLIPSCGNCNRKKGKKDLSANNYIHPYIDNVINDFRFYYELESVKDISIKVDIDGSINRDKIEKSFELFKIKERYNGYKQVTKDLIEIKEIYSEDYLNFLGNIHSLEIDKHKVYELALGGVFEESEFHRKPFSKLIKDISKQLQFIK